MSAYKQPLSKQFYSVLLKFEEKAHSKLITLSEVVNSFIQLTEMTSMYGEIVSYYDALVDPVKFYFMEKLQIFLAEMVLLATKEAEDQKQKIKDHRRISITDMRKSRQKKMTHNIQLQEIQKDELTQFNELLGSYTDNVSQNDINIKQSLEEQNSQLQDRLQQRRIKNQSKMHSQFVSRQGSSSDISGLGTSPDCKHDQSPIKFEISLNKLESNDSTLLIKQEIVKELNEDIDN